MDNNHKHPNMVTIERGQPVRCHRFRINSHYRDFQVRRLTPFIYVATVTSGQPQAAFCQGVQRRHRTSPFG